MGERSEEIKKQQTETSPVDSGAEERSSQKKEGRQYCVYEKFIAAYAGTFSKTFDALLTEVSAKTQSSTGPPIAGSDLYALLFVPDLSKEIKEGINNTFRNIIRYTFEADAILSRLWLTMIRDLSSYLAKNKGIISDLHPLTSRINELATTLFFVYFKMSKTVALKKPDIDRENAAHKKIMDSFKTYLQEEKSEDVDHELKIHTYYRGIPVELNATVLNVDIGSVTFNIHPYEAVALSKVGIAFIYSSLHGTSFKAYTSNVDVEKRTATFSHLIPHDHLNERRAHIRVEPQGCIKTKAIMGTIELSAVLYDISEVASAVYVRNIDPEMFKPDTPVDFIASLPNGLEKGTTLINTSCTIMKIYTKTKGDPHAHRIVLKMGDDNQLKSKLLQYISKRQTEILQELRELSEEA